MVAFPQTEPLNHRRELAANSYTASRPTAVCSLEDSRHGTSLEQQHAVKNCKRKSQNIGLSLSEGLGKEYMKWRKTSVGKTGTQAEGRRVVIRASQG